MDDLTEQERKFVYEYIRDGNGKRAAIAAGWPPRNAAGIATRILKGEMKPHIKAELDRTRRTREMTRVRTATELMEYIHSVIWMNPLEFFEPGDDGGWLLNTDDPKKVPIELGRIIEEMEVRSVEVGDKVVKKVWIRIISKTAMVTLAARYQLRPPDADKDNKGNGQAGVDWDRVLMLSKLKREADPVESRVTAPLMLPPPKKESA